MSSRTLFVVAGAAACLLVAAYLITGGSFRPAESSDAEDCYGAIAGQDFARAAVSCRLAANRGGAGAQHNLALMYQLGKGVPQDPGQAMAWFHKAAEQDLTAAQTQLGMMYEKGWGATRDYADALAWYRRAGEKGDPFALKLLMRMYENGRGVPKDLVKAQALYLIAIERGLPEIAQDSDALADTMTSDDIAAARRMALDCKSQGYKGCGF